MKRTISILLAVVMILSGVSVFADNVMSKDMEAALVSVKSRVDIPEEFSEFSPYAYQEGDDAYYTFEWSKEDGGAYIEVSCDSEGRINRYYFYDNSLKSEKKITSLSKDDIVKFADNFLKKAVSEASLEYDEESWNVSNNTYRLTFRRYVNGNEVKDNYADLRVLVYNDVAYVRNMNVSYNYDAKWASGTPYADGENIYKKEFPLELIYRDVYSYGDDENENRTVLVYRSKDDDYGYVSAINGEPVVEDENNEIYFGSAYGGAMEDMAVENSKNMLSEKEIKELASVEGLISKEDADKIIKNLPSMSISSDMMISSYNITQRDDEYFINLHYETEEEKDYKYLSATLNGSTGKLISLYNGGYYNYEKVELTDSQMKTASEKIDDFLKAVAEEEYGQCKEQEETVYKSKVSKNYDRYVNGVRYINDGITVSYDVKTGVITSYRLDFEKDKIFDDPSNVITVEEAYDSVFDITSLKCLWVLSGGEYVPCFTLKDYGTLIDAFTGKEYVEDTYTEQQSYEYSDIKGHWAEEKINKLAEIQIGLEGDKFNPDAPITQYDLLRLFAAGIHYQSYLTYPEDRLYENFIYDGILTEEEKNPDGQVLREDAFVYMVRLDGLEKVAKLSNIFKVEYADGNQLSEGKIGYPAILTGMNVICGNGGYLKPKTPITRAEAAVMVYNYMINAN